MARRNGFGPLGGRKYVPHDILKELENIKMQDDIPKDSNAFREMAKYSKVGREVKTMSERLVLADIWGRKKKSRKGSIQDVGLAMVILFVMGVMFLTVKYSYVLFVDQATNITSFNSSLAAVEALDATADLTDRFDYVGFVLLIGLTLAIIITGWLVGGHPIFAFIYFIALVILVAVSAIFSFAWEQITDKAIFTDTVAKLPIIDLILTNFPIYITIIGFIGMMVMFAKPRPEE